MKNNLFLIAGVILVIIIVAATLVFEREDSSRLDPGSSSDDSSPGAAEEQAEFVVYFSNTQKNPEATDCALVYPVERMLDERTVTPAQALDVLLTGVTNQEVAQGYLTNINADADIESLSVDHGVATVVFNQAFENELAGSCKVTAVRAQIEQTLKQFSTIHEIVIKVVGVPDEEVLQP